MSTTSTEEWTIGRLLTWTADYLKKRGADSPRLDAEILLAHARGCQRIQLYTAYGELADEPLRAAFRELVRRRSEGVPVAYLVGRREFYSLSFQVTPDVLIPRPETEFVVIETLDRIKQREAGGAAGERCDIVDVGTGSGAIAISLAKHAPLVQLVAVDLSAAALEVARRNAQEHGVTERIEFCQGDLLADLAADRQFDLIVSNPPYVSEAEYAELARDVKDHEPRLALVAGPQGTEIIARLIHQAGERLRPRGWLILEISPMILDAVRRRLSEDAHWCTVHVGKDLAGLPRVVAAQHE
ncbi:MAG: peptide chain release factor N(5)-glutamine methyltransferase [Pirellulales bacterium]